MLDSHIKKILFRKIGILGMGEEELFKRSFKIVF